MRMPVYNILINDKPRRVELAKIDDKSFSVKVDDKTLTVQVNNDEPDLKNPISLRVDGETFEVDLSSLERGKPFQIKVEEVSFKTEIKPTVTKPVFSSFEPAAQIRARKPSAQRDAVEGAVNAPMTGKIVSVRVKKGDQVKQGQALCVIEAMKMENEISAPKAGVVHEVSVSEGTPVNEGDVLIVIG
jgi:biotin carboxyl carrier protein